jgi:aminoglycoside phosphotransferase (APT) family kinase protein
MGFKKNNLSQLAEKIISEKNNHENREKLVLKVQKVLERIVKWAEDYGIDISKIEKLGGGFINLVLLIETAEGKGYVAKAFSEKETANTQRYAQKKINEISKEDEEFIPEVLAWIDENEEGEAIVVSKKAEGRAIRQILENVKDRNNPEAIKEAHRSFYALGATLASLHERTERPVDLTESSLEDSEQRINTRKFKNYLKEHRESGLLDMSDEEFDALIIKIRNITKSGFVSLVHGDAHLDQFFKAPDKSIVTIVDYDSLHEDDPMVDVSRSLASLRDWGRKLEIPDLAIIEVEKKLFEGYRDKRVDIGYESEAKFNQVKIIAYEARLSLTQLRYFGDFRKELRSLLPENLNENSFYKAYENGEIKNLKSYKLNDEQIEQLNELLAIKKNLLEIIEYLQLLEHSSNDN